MDENYSIGEKRNRKATEKNAVASQIRCPRFLNHRSNDARLSFDFFPNNKPFAPKSSFSPRY
jgi:hypothetical protein